MARDALASQPKSTRDHCVADASFTKQQRILGKAGFESVFAARQRVRRGPLVVAWCAQAEIVPAGTLLQARLGIAVSKRHARHAALRNRIKRHVREVFRQHVIAGQAVACVVYLGEVVNACKLSASAWQALIREAFDQVAKRQKP